MQPAMRLGVVCGLEFEADIVRRRTRHEGLADRILVGAGLGRARARAVAEQLLADGASSILSFGLAGGLDPLLGCGATVIGTSIAGEVLSLMECSPEWAERMARAFEAGIRGPIAHAPEVLATRADKSQLFGATGGLAADMESYGAGEAAAAAGVPFAALRVIADSAADDLPEIARHAIAADGTLNLAETLGRIARNPRQIPALLRLGRSAARAERRLDQLAAAGAKELFFSPPR